MNNKKELIIRVLSNYVFDENLKQFIRQNYLKNYCLNSGERQTAKNLEGIRADHTARYELVAEYINQNNQAQKLKILDVFCGNGYGSYLMASKIHNSQFLSIDGSKEAVKFAQKYYHNKNIRFKQKFFPFKLKQNQYDYVVSLESVEHVKDDIDFLKTIYKSLKKDGILFLSTPNENKQSLEINANHFHYRHYDTAKMIETLAQIGFRLLKIYGQDVYVINDIGKVTGLLNSSEMNVIENYDGQFCVYILKKI